MHPGSADDIRSFTRPPDIHQDRTGVAEASPMNPDAETPPSHHDTPSSGPESSTPTTSSYSPGSIYLDRKFVLGFSVLFGVTLVAIEIVNLISIQRHGLANGRYQLHYLWKYGTTAVFTPIVAFWVRVEYNVKMIAPWLQLSSGPKDASRTVLLDYISPFPTTTVYQAVRFRDYSVVAAILVTVILRVLIVLSTSLITLAPIRIELREVPAILQYTFRDTALAGWPLPAPLEGGVQNYVNSQVYMALINGEYPYPIGLDKDFSYQDFSVELEGIERFNLTVDAFSGMLECKETNYIKLLPGTLPPYYSQTVEEENCTHFLNITFPEKSSRLQYYSRVLLSECQENAQGNGTSFYYPPVNQRNYYALQILAMEITHDHEPSHNNDTDQSGLITRVMERSCKPSFVVNNVSVTRSTGQNDSFILMKQQPHSLPNTRPWGGFADLEQILNTDCTHGGCLFEPSDGSCEASCNLSTIAINGTGTQSKSIALDGFLALALRKGLEESPASVAERFFDSTFIDENVGQLFGSYGAYLGYLLYRDQANGATANATVTMSRDRLLVTPIVAHVMAGLLGLCLILSLSMITLFPKRNTLPPRPTTIMDMAILAHQSPPFIESLRGFGAQSEKFIRSQIRSRNYKLDLVHGPEPETKQFLISQVDNESTPEQHGGGLISEDQTIQKTRHPLVLYPVTRLILALLVAAMITTLEITLRLSERNSGLMDVGSKDYVEYGWMYLPAIILSLTSLYYGAVEFQVRLLAPYQNLSLGAPSPATLLLDLTDKLSVTAFLTAIRMRQFAVAAAILASFITAFLTIASASLFSVQQVSADSVPTRLVPQDILNYVGSWDARSYNSTSLLAASLNYPAFTFQNLVYPSLWWNKSIDHLSNSSNDDDIYIKANIPAARSSLNCTIYTRPQLEASLGLFGSVEWDTPTPCIHVKFPGNNCTGVEGNFHMKLGDESLTARDFYFGVGLPGSELLFATDFTPDETLPPDADNFIGCTSYLYAWGRVLNWTNNDFSVVGMGCDEQIQEVNTKLTLSGSDLEIRHDHPPQVDNSSTRTVAYAPKGCRDSMLDCDNNLINLYSDLNHVFSTEALDNFFSALTIPGGLLALNQSLLGNELMAQSVADAVIFQHQVLRGQALSESIRTPIDTSDKQSTTASLSDPSGLLFPANVSATDTKSRVVQDAIATRILEALLGSVLAFSFLAWIASPNTNILPRSPVSIVSVATWIAEGDILDLLPHDYSEIMKSGWNTFFDGEYFYMRTDQHGRLGIRSAQATFAKEGAGRNRSLSPADQIE